MSPRYASVQAVLRTLWEIAAVELHGVGDAAAGEWREPPEPGDRAVHLRRRLTAAEMKYAGIEAVVDVRDTPEHRTRIERMRPFLPPPMRDLPLEQFP